MISMATSIKFPDEKTMKVKDLDNLKDNLIKMIKNISKKKNLNLNELINCLGLIQGYLLIADKKKKTEYFKYFIEKDFIETYNKFINLNNDSTNLCILDSIIFLITNISNNEFIKYLYTRKFKSNFYGMELNIIEKLACLHITKNEDFLTRQINFIKSLVLKLDADSVKYFYYSDINQFPILTKSFSLYNYPEPLIRNVVKAIVLAVIRIEDKNLRQYLASFPINLYYSNLIFKLKNSILSLCEVEFGGDDIKKDYNTMHNYHDKIIESFLFLSDIIKLNIEDINFIIINCLLNEIILPLIYSIEENYRGSITTYHSLYFLCLILFTTKNELIYNIINYFLFKEEISRNIYDKLSKVKYNPIEKLVMDNINFLIINSQDADINEPKWKQISNLMKETNGIDLSIGEKNPENLYDYFKKEMNFENKKDNLKNPIFESIKKFFLCYDDSIILTLNLIIYLSIKFNKEENNENNNLDDNKQDKKEDENLNIINENNKENKKNSNIYDILNNNFFKINLEDNKSDNIFNHLYNYLNSSKNFRIATNEIILCNMQLLMNIFLEKNKNEIKYKEIFAKKFLVLIEKQIDDINGLFKKEPNINKYIFDSSLKSFEYYVKNSKKKINDLIIQSNILVNIMYIDKIENIPLPLKDGKFPYHFLKNYISKIFFINDIIYELYDKTNDTIKKNKFPLNVDTFKLSIGKIYHENELGEEYVHCKILRNNKLYLCEAILSADTLYFGEVMSGNFDDLSQIKIIKKIPLRYLDFKKTDQNCIINIYDKSIASFDKNFIEMDCLTLENTFSMNNYLNKQRFDCLILEETIFNNFIKDLKKNLYDIII